ncbi:putative defense protein 1 [Watersipora subatra]|uniref:putative defense protein 1 n=1 Tax=Watersipora subatra TaxID=2589382 RepID=UPI00355B2FC0
MTSQVFGCFFFFLTGVSSYATGPPESACQDAVPRHTPHQKANETCPFLVDFTAFEPGIPQLLNITSWSGQDTFKGYQLTIFAQNRMAVGTFGTNERTICQGAAATHREGRSKLHAPVMWTPPRDSSGQLYYIWLTVVQNYSSFWVDCDPIIFPASDAIDFFLTSSTQSSIAYSTYSEENSSIESSLTKLTTEGYKLRDGLLKDHMKTQPTVLKDEATPKEGLQVSSNACFRSSEIAIQIAGLIFWVFTLCFF